MFFFGLACLRRARLLVFTASKPPAPISSTLRPNLIDAHAPLAVVRNVAQSMAPP
jgi:hypothetical protein